MKIKIFMKFEILVTRDVLTATCPGLNLFPLTVVSAEALQGESFIDFVVRKSVFRENDLSGNSAMMKSRPSMHPKSQ